MKTWTVARSLAATFAASGLIALGTLATPSGHSTLPAAWKNWRYSRAIELPATDMARLVEVSVADEVYLQSKPSLQDVRIIDGQGNEIPYTTLVLDGAKKKEDLAARVHERSFTPGKYTQTVIEIQGNAPFHNSLEIETPEQNFIEWTSVEASDDARVWRIVQERAPIFRFTKEGRDGTRIIHYSENNARYLRVRVLNGEKQFPVAGVVVLHETSGPEERLPLEAEVVLQGANGPARQTIWTADLGWHSAPATEVHFEVAPMEFVRCVDLSASDDKKEWNTIASGQIYRFHQGDKVQKQLTVPISYGGATGRYWRVTVENGNDAPLANASVRLYTTPRHVVFEQQPGKSYSLIYGQERVQAAEYDLGRRLDVAQQMAAVPGKLGPEEVNSVWVDPRPWTETHAVFLWGVLLIAVIVIGSTAIQSMRRAASSPDA
jgi:Protein of unknown function (DUF3999)